MKELTELQKRIITGKFIYSYTDCELANMLGLSRQTIQANKNAALKQIKITINKGR